MYGTMAEALCHIECLLVMFGRAENCLDARRRCVILGEFWHLRYARLMNGGGLSTIYLQVKLKNGILIATPCINKRVRASCPFSLLENPSKTRDAPVQLA